MNDPKKTYDLAIIGGGIAGAGIARDAVLRGAQTVLFEKNTYGSGTSSKSSQLIHGGIRYLQVAWNHFKKGHFGEGWKNFKFVFNALRESQILRRIAPDLVIPIDLTIPVYKNRGDHIFMIYLGTLLYAFLAFLSGSKKMPIFLGSKQKILARIPTLNPDTLIGGVVIWDHQTRDQTLVERTLANAVENGLLAFEHTKVLRYEYLKNEKCYQVTVQKDAKEQLFFARKLVNATGAWVDQIRAANGERNSDFIVPIAGAHIHLKKFTEHSVILEAEDGRIFFVINQGNTARIGTTERLHQNPDQVDATQEEIDYLVKELNYFFPNEGFSKADILSHDAGIRPLAKPKHSTEPHDISREHELRVGPTGVYHVLGVKLTDHRRAAEDILNKIAPALHEWVPGMKKTSSTHQVKL